MPFSVLEVTLFWLPVVLSTTLYGIEFAGYVALAQRLLSAPLALVGRSLSDVYQVRITGHGEAISNRMVRMTFLLIGGTLALAAPACIILWLWGPPIFVFVFGGNWSIAGEVVAILAPLAVFQLCGGIVTRLLIEIGRQELRLVAFLALLISMLITFYLGSSLQWTAITTLSVMSVNGCTIFALWIVASLLVFRTATRSD